MAPSLFFDKQDHALLAMVNRMLEPGSKQPGRQLFNQSLHPHGVKELAASREMRIAFTVINLIHSLEEGQAPDRLHALSSLYEEVVSVTDSTFRFNTGRALIQIMKELIRTQAGTERRLILAHTFRRAAQGNRRFVRKVLRDYHLLEMPEEWNQLAFDHHVHDSHTKGRKTPSHLIMDAWIKGIRKLTVIYYNYVESCAVQELFQAAQIMGIKIQIGIEYRGTFRGKQVTFIWEPPSLVDIQFLESFLGEESVQALMREGRAASEYYVLNVLTKLKQYNESLRYNIASYFGVELKEIKKENFLQFVGSGQPSLLHLADLVHQEIFSQVKAFFPDMREEWATATDPEAKALIEEKAEHYKDMYPEIILEKWFIANPNHQPGPTKEERESPDIPPLLITPAKLLVDRLHVLRNKSNIRLATDGLSPEDVLELLYSCEGKITHLELFNLKEYAKGRLVHQEAISALQFAINQDNAIVLKQLITDITERYREKSDEASAERLSALMEILYNIPKLLFYYRDTALRTRIGSDSTSRSSLFHGMGFVYVDTLPPSAVKELKKAYKKNFRMKPPLYAKVATRITFTPPPADDRDLDDRLLALLRKVPGFRFKGYNKTLSWKPLPESFIFKKDAGSLTTLGGLRNTSLTPFKLEPQEAHSVKPGLGNINTRFVNILKVAIGFALAMATFAFTQEWRFLAWMGAPIWFFITGVRNIFQAVLAGRGFRHSSLLHWRDYINWSRISDSLLFTGISVPLLELVLRWGVLGKLFGVTAASSPLAFFITVSTANGFYIAGHNLLRGLQKEAVIGNIFRSVLAVPLSLVFNAVLVIILTPFGPLTLALLADSAAIVSKAASDTVAGIIEGFADRRTNLGMRRWDYIHKLRQLFSCYSRLDVLLPEQDTLEALREEAIPLDHNATEAERLQISILVHSLDLMYFLLYQPRARTMLQHFIRDMTERERVILMKTQLILTRERAVSQALVNGEVVHDFARVLAFYLNRYQFYLEDLSRLTRVPVNISKSGSLG